MEIFGNPFILCIFETGIPGVPSEGMIYVTDIAAIIYMQ